MHDATEAYIADISAPFKGAFTNYHEIEERIWLRIAHKYGLEPVLDPCIKEADWIALFAEALELQPLSRQETWYGWDRWGLRGKNRRDIYGIPALQPLDAKERFLHAFRELQALCKEAAYSPRAGTA